MDSYQDALCYFTMWFVTWVLLGTFICKANRKLFEKTLRHLIDFLEGPFCLWDAGTARILNLEASKRLFVSLFHFLISFILFVGFFHFVSHKRSHRAWQKLFLDRRGLVSNGELKQTKNFIYGSDWPNQSHKTLGQSPKANGTKYVSCVFLNVSTFFRNKGIIVIWKITQLWSITE